MTHLSWTLTKNHASRSHYLRICARKVEVPTPSMTSLGERHKAAMGLRGRDGNFLDGVCICDNLRVPKTRWLKRIWAREIKRGRQARRCWNARIRERGRVDIHTFLNDEDQDVGGESPPGEKRSLDVLFLKSFWRVWSVDGIALANGNTANATQTGVHSRSPSLAAHDEKRRKAQTVKKQERGK